MRRPILGTLFALACVSIVSLPASAAPNRWDGWKPYETHYLGVYEKCWKAFKADCGRNVVDDGMANGKQPSQARVEQSSATMERWLNPPVVQGPVASSSSAVVAPTPTSTVAPVSGGACGGITPYEGAGQCWAIPYDIVACESGGNYSAYNESGASGAYQLMDGGQGTPAEQDAAAAALYAGGAGRSNWVC